VTPRCPVVFVHGAWHGKWCWEEHFLDRFAAAGHDAYALDLPGHGGAVDPARPLWRLRIADYVAAVHEVVHDLPPTTALVGHSMGGYVVQRYLTRHRAGPAVLLAPIPPSGVAGATFRVARTAPGPFVATIAHYRLWPIVADPRRAARLLFDPDLPEDEAIAYARRLQDESFSAYLDTFLPIRTRAIRSPVLVVGASEDAIFSPRALASTARAYGTEPLVIEGAGHDLMLGRRWERVAATILRWLGDTLDTACE